MLYISLIQPNIIWEDKAANLAEYEKTIEGIAAKKEVIILPEMFSTGFSMAPERLAETMDGPTVAWMKNMSRKHRCIITGSLIIEENGHYYNRLIWMQPDGNFGIYDKRHLFGYAKENDHYSPGEKRLIAQVKGIRICLQVCYDLRFPVWARNQGDEYDVLIYVANWPERRNLAWKTLLQARAIENLSYVIGVNRVGEDGNGIYHSGDSSVFGPTGELIWQEAHEATVFSFIVDKEVVQNTREHFPFLNDADKFLFLD
ncbi:amidohydrolase [Taibaiella soli]|uniref:Omega-amidase YafV n=1 Tax=Taibaiella soli TaxID=1649169 RepID=A0A2W2AH13_9BACT|nr:amidohydrolase [Taibaiella soli]PZF72822.1 amidohydrolase [Taibaiella soli]